MRKIENTPTVRYQLASVWGFISGAGARHRLQNGNGHFSIWVWRNKKWLVYDSTITVPHGPIDHVGGFQQTDEVHLYATEDCVLTYKDQRWQLTKGWNRIHWPIEPAVPIEPPVEQTGFEILPWLLGGAAVVIGLVVVHKSAK